ncbi:MAG: putative toxin-antitoxin system toxin component, PIN family [Cyclobacteriaceae bacterium]|nr:putative toxin-antitoxin system toxin component, PIN family [Cyclobacteriaceae bacterium]
MRLTFDSNVLIRALLSDRSFSATALFKAEHLSAEILFSNATLAEAIEVIMRPKFDKVLTIEIRKQFLEQYERSGSKIIITRQIRACRDPKDDMYLELALSGLSDCIISNDEDLLALNPFEGIPIISPKEFLERYS